MDFVMAKALNLGRLTYVQYASGHTLLTNNERVRKYEMHSIWAVVRDVRLAQPGSATGLIDRVN
jgi:hypothetical protein